MFIKIEMLVPVTAGHEEHWQLATPNSERVDWDEFVALNPHMIVGQIEEVYLELTLDGIAYLGGGAAPFLRLSKLEEVL